MKRTDVTWATVGIVAVCLIMALTSGCIEEQQVKPQWGQGDPPAAWQETFGNDNGARVDYVQMRMFGEVDARLKALESFCKVNNVVDPNGVSR